MLGSTGLIGHQVYNYLKANSDYHLTNISYRKKLQDDTILLDVRDEETLVNHIKKIGPNYIVNCIGILISESNRDPEKAIFIKKVLRFVLSLTYFY